MKMNHVERNYYIDEKNQYWIKYTATKSVFTVFASAKNEPVSKKEFLKNFSKYFMERVYEVTGLGNINTNDILINSINIDIDSDSRSQLVFEVFLKCDNSSSLNYEEERKKDYELYLKLKERFENETT